MSGRNDDPPYPPDVLVMLQADHTKVRALLADYEAARERELKRSIAALVWVELEIHMQLEACLFYPAVNDATDAGPELVTQSLEDHQRIQALIQELREIGPHIKVFDDTFHELARLVEDHIQAEEATLFPLAEAALKDHPDALLDEMQALKQALLAS